MKNLTEFSVSTSEAARSVVDDANDWYKRPEVRADLERIAKDVYDWLIENKEAADRDGDGKSRDGSWLPMSGWDYTEDPARLDLRRAGVRNRLYEHGLRRYLNRMVSSDLLSGDAYVRFDVAATFEMKALHEELIGYRLSSIPKIQSNTVNLVDLRKRFNMSANTNTTKIRNGRLVVMAGFGLWSVRIDNDGNYAIRAGEVAMIFHTKVFAPVLLHFEQFLNGTPSKEK
ncbi:MAG: hypothetical protein ABJV68_31965 [Paracoccaceae bacterium]